MKDSHFPSPEGFSLATVFMAPNISETKVITADWVHEKVQAYKHLDEVFHEVFLAGVVFLGASEDQVEVSDEARTYLSRSGTQWIRFIRTLDAGSKVLPGPYAISGNRLRDVWRLVDDTSGTCMTTFRPQQQQGSFEQLRLKSSDGQSLAVALPSRIKAQAISDSPIAGWRVVVKDNIHLQGVKSSVGNKAFYNTYPPQSVTAECIKRLVDCGVVIAGKAKMSSFGNWEEPTDYTDYQAPWNPRGDQYQSPGASSSGSAAAVSSYDWLDVAIGTDTWGSVTRPSLWCGCFGLRPSLGAVSTKAVEPYVSAWDIPGLLSRDIQKCKEFASAWLLEEGLEKSPKPFSSVVWPTDFWGIMDPDQSELAHQFVKDILLHLGLKPSEISFEEVWSKSPPSEAGNLSLSDYIDPATGALAYDAYHNSDDFRETYRNKFHQEPYTTHPNQKIWGAGKMMSKEERDKGFQQIGIYERWFKNTILTGEHSNALIVLPLENMGPRYRDEPPTFKRPPQDGINALSLGPVMKAPVLAVPIGEVTYVSNVTKNMEKLPFVVAVMAPPGTDLALLDTVKEVLESAGRPTAVNTGKTMFDM